MTKYYLAGAIGVGIIGYIGMQSLLILGQSFHVYMPFGGS